MVYNKKPWGASELVSGPRGGYKSGLVVKNQHVFGERERK